MNDKEMLLYLLELTGKTEEDIQREVYKDRIVELAGQGKTIGEMLDVAKKEKWEPVLLNTKFADIMPTRKAAGKRSSTGGRMTKEETKELQGAILAFLKKNNDSSISQIAEGVGTEVGKVRGQLIKMKAQGQVTTKGSKRDMTYSI
jgi:hypothetical protein